jgi:hypothetical protein
MQKKTAISQFRLRLHASMIGTWGRKQTGMQIGRITLILSLLLFVFDPYSQLKYGYFISELLYTYRYDLKFIKLSNYIIINVPIFGKYRYLISIVHTL